MSDTKFQATIRGWGDKAQQHRAALLLTMTDSRRAALMQKEKHILLIPREWWSKKTHSLAPHRRPILLHSHVGFTSGKPSIASLLYTDARQLRLSFQGASGTSKENHQPSSTQYVHTHGGKRPRSPLLQIQSISLNIAPGVHRANEKERLVSATIRPTSRRRTTVISFQVATRGSKTTDHTRHSTVYISTTLRRQLR